MHTLRLPRFVLTGLLALHLGGVVMAADDTNVFFPIMAWNHAPADPAVLKQMREAGITVAGFVYAPNLDLCQAAGLKAIVYDQRVAGYDWAHVNADVARSNVTSLIKEVGSHPAVYGYYLRDEPPTSLFPGLATVAGLLREMAPGKWPYINLFPDYAENWQLGTSNYAAYLDQFVDACNPSIISYDNYSLMDDGSVRGVFWSNLESVRAKCVSSHIEFWNIVLSVAHFNYRELSHADFRFQAYATLLYGGRGLAYFTYFAPQVGNYRLAPVDQFGNRTANWYFLQNVNNQVLTLAPTLLKLTSDDVYHFGALPPGAHAPGTNSLVTAVAGDNAAVGEFTHQDGSRYVMILNKDLGHSRPCSVSYRKPPKKVQFVSPYYGSLTPFEGEYVWMAPGAAVLLKPEW